MHVHNALYNLGSVLYIVAILALTCVMLAHLAFLELDSFGQAYLTMLAISLTFQGTIATVLSQLRYDGAKKKFQA